MSINNSKWIAIILIIVLLLSSCSIHNADAPDIQKNSAIHNSNASYIQENSLVEPIIHDAAEDDEHVERVEKNEKMDIELNEYKTARVWDPYDLIDVRVNSVEVEKEQIKSVESTEYDYFSILYDNAINEDMVLNSAYVYLSVNITLHGEKNFDKLYLSSFRIYYTLNNKVYTEGIAYQNSIINKDNPHEYGVVNYNAGEEKDVTIGFIVPKQILQSKNISLLARFADFGENNTEKSPMFKISDGLSIE